jgi:hypothetical protein
MTIQVRSNEAPEADKAKAPSEESKSAPEADASEQNPSSESDTEEAEANESDEDDSSDADGDEPEVKDDAKDKPKKKGGFQRRIDKLNAAKADAQREAEYWKREALKAAGGESKNSEAKKPAPTPQEGKPNPDHFESHSEYVEALTDWKVDQKQKARDAEANRKALESEQKAILQKHTERVQSFAAKTEDFEEMVAGVEDITISTALQELIVSSDNGPELIYELAKNRSELERIAKLSPLAAAREIGKLETRIAAGQASAGEKKPEPKKITKAPKPIDPVGGGKGAVAKSIDDPTLSQAEYERMRREHMKRRGA